MSARDHIVLIVEDDPSNSSLMAAVLEADGFKTRIAANGREALAALGIDPLPHCILLNLMMPVMNGWEFRTRQKQNPLWADIPVVIVSGLTDIQMVAREVGAAGYVPKPFLPSKLVAAVRAVCDLPVNP